MVYDRLDELEQRWRWQHWSRAERYHNEAHYKPSGDSKQDGADDGIATQQRDSGGAHDEDGGNHKGYQVVKDHPEQSGGKSTCECHIAQRAAGNILHYCYKWGLIEKTKN